jgi:hypothetical protein
MPEEDCACAPRYGKIGQLVLRVPLERPPDRFKGVDRRFDKHRELRQLAPISMAISGGSAAPAQWA